MIVFLKHDIILSHQMLLKFKLINKEIDVIITETMVYRL